VKKNKNSKFKSLLAERHGQKSKNPASQINKNPFQYLNAGFLRLCGEK
jgi:hypothetical protein